MYSQTVRRWFFLCMGLILVGFWPLWIGLFARRHHWSADHIAFVSAQRRRVAAWLIVIELVLVQGVLFRFIQEMVR